MNNREAERRLQQVGPNRLASAAARGPVTRFFSQFHNLLIYALLLAGIITAAIEHWIDSGGIFGVVLLNALIGLIQEDKAEKRSMPFAICSPIWRWYGGTIKTS